MKKLMKTTSIIVILMLLFSIFAPALEVIAAVPTENAGDYVQLEFAGATGIANEDTASNVATVTVQYANENTVTVSGEGLYAANSENKCIVYTTGAITITANPTSAYNANITVDGTDQHAATTTLNDFENKNHLNIDVAFIARPTYNVNFGTASWVIEETTVTASVTGKTINNNEPVSLVENETITLTNFDPETMKAKVAVTEGFNSTLVVNNGTTTMASLSSGNYPQNPGTITFTVEAIGENPGPGPEQPDPQDPEPNWNSLATITLTAGEGTWTRTYTNQQGQEVEEQVPYTAAADISINNGDILDSMSLDNNHQGQVGFNAEENAETVDITFNVMWHERLYDQIVINGTPYTVSQYMNYNDKDTWLEHYDQMHVSFTIPNVPRHYDNDENETYVIVVKVGQGKNYLANFLWTADPDQKYEKDQNGQVILDDDGNPVPGRNYIGNSTIELVKAKYRFKGTDYTVTKEQLLALEPEVRESGVTYTTADGLLSYGFDPNVDFDDGGLNLPEGSTVTMRCIPDYGYQVTSVNGGNDFTVTNNGVCEFTLTVESGAMYFIATVEEIDNDVKASTDKVESGSIVLGADADKDIQAGTARLTIDDIVLSNNKKAEFEEAAGDYEITDYLDINLHQIFYKGTDDEDEVWDNRQIHNLRNEATITLKLADGVNGNDIVIVHNINNGEEFEIIPIDSYDPITNTITFRTSSFSNYAIASRETDGAVIKEVKGITTKINNKNVAAFNVTGKQSDALTIKNIAGDSKIATVDGKTATDNTIIKTGSIIVKEDGSEFIVVIFGDVASNGKLNTGDVIAIQQLFVGLLQGSDLLNFAGDLDGNNKINTADALILQRYIAGITNTI